MSEGPPQRPSYDELMKVWKEDMADPVRGPIVKMVREVNHAAAERDFNDPLFLEWGELQQSFPRQFGDSTWTPQMRSDEAKRYRLYHFAIGSTPEGDLFDTEGDNSLANGFRKIAERYGIQTDNDN